MIAKLKHKIRVWLGIEAMHNTMTSTYDHTVELYKKVEEQTDEIRYLNKELELFKSVCQVGIDVHMKTDSWAVVCLDGKAEYVNFVKLDSRDARDIKYFIKRFEKSNIKIDAPYGMIDSFKW